MQAIRFSAVIPQKQTERDGYAEEANKKGLVFQQY